MFKEVEFKFLLQGKNNSGTILNVRSLDVSIQLLFTKK